MSNSNNMLAGRDIVILASQAWDSHWCTPQQIASRLARDGCRVLYVEPLRSPLWRARKAATQSSNPSGPPKQVAERLWIYTLPALFLPLAVYSRWPLLNRLFNHTLMSWLVRRAARKLGFRDAVTWVYQVTHQGASLLKKSTLTVYDCIDEWAGTTSDPRLRRYLQEIDRRMCREADVLFLGSQTLAAFRSDLNPRQEVVPQGVDMSNFLRASQPGLPRPADMVDIPSPIIGLMGVLNRERLDVPLICHLADRRPNWSLVLVGPVWAGLDVEQLKSRPNIHLLGNKPVDKLGDYLGAFDVCMLPYLLNDFTRSIFPLKLFEYLASGKPFVSTPIPACTEFPRLIRTATSRDMFLLAIEAGLNEEDTSLRTERIAAARVNDWDRRTTDKARFVAEELKKRGIPSPLNAEPAEPGHARA